MPRKRGRPVHAVLYEDGSVKVTGPRGSRGVGNVGEGGRARGGRGTVRQFGPTLGRAGISSRKTTRRKRK